jgi:hypothetical protein
VFDGPAAGRLRLSLTNLAQGRFYINDPNGKFAITLKAPLPPGAFVWVVQQTLDSAKASSTQISAVVRVSSEFGVRKASISVSGTDSASRDAGGTAALDLGFGAIDKPSGSVVFLSNATYDDKWKVAPHTANITQNYGGTIENYHQLTGRFYAVPFANAYHNNTQGIRLEQFYGGGIAARFSLPDGTAVELDQGAQAMLENLYAPGKNARLVGLREIVRLEHYFAGGIDIQAQADVNPVLNQARSWKATANFSLDVPLSSRWSFSFAVTDNYYEIAPATFNKNYLLPAIGISFK